jgi:hypothetical protein
MRRSAIECKNRFDIKAKEYIINDVRGNKVNIGKILD